MLLSENELLHLCIRQKIPVIGRYVVDAIRASEPGRRVGRGALNVATRFASRKMGCVIQAESHKCELPALYLWEHDPDTYEFYDQPPKVKLTYLNGGGKRVSPLSTPDYFLIQKNWMGWVECKTEEELQQSYDGGSERFIPDGKGGWRCPPGEAYAEPYGLGFRVYSSKETNWIVIRNLEFLAEYLQENCPMPAPETREALMRQFGNERWLLLQELLATDGVSADMVFTLIAFGHLFIDFEHELLSEPGFTNVCRDPLGAEVYQQQKRGACKQTTTSLHSVLLAGGTTIVWDGFPWRILNVGASEVCLEDPDKNILTLRLDTLQSLVVNGSISGIPLEVDSRHDHAADILKRAAPIDLGRAVMRAHLLDGLDDGSITVSQRVLRKWQKLAREGEIAYGNRFVALLPRISARGNRLRKVDSEVVEVMNMVIDTEVLTASKANITICYGNLINLCDAQGLLPPSEKTFRAEIKRRREEIVILARQGRRAAYNITEFCWQIDQSTPRHGERPFEIGHIDHTELDVELVDSRTGANLRRPWLTVLLDAFTRLVLAFYLTFDPPSYRSCMAVIRLSVQRHGRIPMTIVVDRGSDFESVYFESLLARLGCHKKSRPTAKARFGSVIERFFGVNNTAFIHNLVGNNQALQRPRSMSPSHDPRRLAVWTLPALIDAFEAFVDTVYANVPHPALGMSPKDAMARGLAMSGNRSHVLIPFSDEFKCLCMPTTPLGNAVVRTGRGIKIKGIFYWHSSFRESSVVRTSVPLRYDPFDVSSAYALVNGEWVLCRSEYQALLERRTEREIAAISQEIRTLHCLAEARRGVNAAQIAAYIGQARETERVLLQQRRDAERQCAEAGNGSEKELSPVVPMIAQAPAMWDCPIAIEDFEELK